MGSRFNGSGQSSGKYVLRLFSKLTGANPDDFKSLLKRKVIAAEESVTEE